MADSTNFLSGVSSLAFIAVYRAKSTAFRLCLAINAAGPLNPSYNFFPIRANEGQAGYFEGLHAFEDDLVFEVGEDLIGDLFNVDKVGLPRRALSLLVWIFKG